MITIEDMYKHVGVLADAKDKAGDHKEEYTAILGGIKGGSNEKRLASQFIARFFKFFPDLGEQSLDAMFDLCEDDDVNIRKQAIKDLPALCKEMPEFLSRIADILTQLLQSDDNIERSLVHMSLLVLLKFNVKGTLSGIFSQVMVGDEVIRERAITFLSLKLKVLSPEVLTKDIEDYIVQESKKILQDVTGTEFLAFMHLLGCLESMQTMKGRQVLLDIVTEQAGLGEPFTPSDSDLVDRLMQCVKQAMPLFSKNVHSDKFLAYICVNVLPHLSEITSTEEAMQEEKAATNGNAAAATGKVDPQLDILKLVAEMSVYCGGVHMEGLAQHVEAIFNALVEYMPLPPADVDSEAQSETEEPKLQFSYVECLMFTFHQIARHVPTFLTEDNSAARLKDFRLRLQYFARGVQLYIKQLRATLQGKSGDLLKTEQNKIQVVALKITNNINVLIKDLFHNPPAYKANVSLSFRPVAAAKAAGPEAAAGAGQKRAGITPISLDGLPASKKPVDQSGGQKLYSPPQGKFSDQAGKFSQGRGRGGFRGNRGRGGYRGYTRRW